MAAQQYEVEIKGLLGTEERADEFKHKLTQHRTPPRYTGISKQLNHYFKGGKPEKLLAHLGTYLSGDSKKKLKTIIASGRDISVRTRQTNTEVIFVVKASVGSDTSSNGVARIEVEQPVKLTLDALDKKLLAAGYTYQAKWSRKRETYQIQDVTICLDKNAGYGYLVEFEKVLTNEKGIAKTRTALLKLMKQFKVAELKQSKLENMFAHYNNNWRKYYGTDAVFDSSKM